MASKFHEGIIRFNYVHLEILQIKATVLQLS